jgi:crotonobetainyl-CoA:carnitine CoA-transferase CaiB-like acyl-CoA transferase
MAQWTGERSSEECLAALQAANIPGAPVLSPQDALDHPHINALKLMIPLAYPGVGEPAPVAPVPMKLSETPGGIRHRAPTLGEHTDEILGELGYDGAAIGALRQAGVV